MKRYLFIFIVIIMSSCLRNWDNPFDSDNNISHQPPTATTNSANNISFTTATLNGTVNANEQNTTVTFEYGRSTNYGSTVSASPSTVTGTSNTSVSANISGLTEERAYHYRIKAVSAAGTTYGSDVEFITLVQNPPTATTNAATNITMTTATLNGMVNANGYTAVVTFEYGTTIAYGDSIAANPNVVTDSTIKSVSANIGGLTGNTTYHFRVKVFSVVAAGPIYGSDQVFTTTSSQPIPTVTTGPAENIDFSSATLTGEVNANGNNLTVLFLYANVNPNSGFETVTANQSPVSGNTNTFVSVNLSGLTENTTYVFKVRAYNTAVSVWGENHYFTTATNIENCSDFQITHTAGDVAPVSKTISYRTVVTDLSGAYKCWITQNLGADKPASSTGYTTEGEAGWYWQFNKKQGYKYDGTNRIPNTTWITSISEASDWTSANDPCTILLGNGWRIPTESELRNASDIGEWNNINDAFESVLKLNNSGHFYYDWGDNLVLSTGGYWSSSQFDFNGAYGLELSDIYGLRSIIDTKATGYSIRCLRD